MSHAALSAFVLSNPNGISVVERDAAGDIIETTRRYLGLDHGNTEMSMAAYFDQQAASTPQIILTNDAPVEAAAPVAAPVSKHLNIITLRPSYGDLVTQLYAARREAAMRDANRAPKP